jgi:acyl-CoA reductase-like NAD-dependent aldehyde dehydrogenase
VFESVADEVIEAIVAKAGRLKVGLGSEPSSQIGPVHSARQLEILERQVAHSVAAGGELLVGGGRPEDPALAAGHFYAPTVVLEPPRDSPMAQEEWINSATKVYDELPFGGIKASGVGKEHGSEALDFYTDTKSVVVKQP